MDQSKLILYFLPKETVSYYYENNEHTLCGNMTNLYNLESLTNLQPKGSTTFLNRRAMISPQTTGTIHNF